MQVTTVGLDLAKRVLQAHGVDAGGRVVIRRKLQCGEVAAFFADLPSAWAWRHARQRITEVGCRVPNAHLEACRSKLHEEAQTRIARAGGGRWRRKDLEAVVRADEGYLASAPELEHYVHPTNWSDLRATMARDLAAIIIGQSGPRQGAGDKHALRRAAEGSERICARATVGSSPTIIRASRGHDADTRTASPNGETDAAAAD